MLMLTRQLTSVTFFMFYFLQPNFIPMNLIHKDFMFLKEARALYFYRQMVKRSLG